MKRLPALLALVAVLMFGAAGMASADTITFDVGSNIDVGFPATPTYLPPTGSPIASVTNMTWDGSDGVSGHLWCSDWSQDSIISFTNPTYVNNFQMNGMPSGIPLIPEYFTFGPMDIVALNAANEQVWSFTVSNLDEYTDLKDTVSGLGWLTLEVNTGNVSSIIFRSPNPIDWVRYPSTGVNNEGPMFNPSIDNLVITEAASVPIPASVWLVGSGLLGLVGLRRKFSC